MGGHMVYAPMLVVVWSLTLIISQTADQDSSRYTFHYVGCFADQQNRSLPNVKLNLGANTTVENCVAICNGREHQYAGLQYAQECHCGDSLDLARIYGTTQGACTTPCQGNQSQICGGTWLMSVYEITPSVPTTKTTTTFSTITTTEKGALYPTATAMEIFSGSTDNLLGDLNGKDDSSSRQTGLIVGVSIAVLSVLAVLAGVTFFFYKRRVRDAPNKQHSYVKSDVQSDSTKLNKSAAVYENHAEGTYQNAAFCEKETNNRLTSGDFCDIYYSAAGNLEDPAPHVYDVLELELEPSVITSPTSLSCVGVEDLAANVYTLAEPIH